MNRIEEQLELVLPLVEKPSRYMGNELNMVRKPVKDKIRFAFAFPDVYEVGMSHLGMKILYDTINQREDSYCERVFAPWTDMEEQMRTHGIPLFSLETKSALTDFDILGFTLQYEMSFSNILNMLELSNIPFYAREREDGPFLIAGGPCAYNPEPIAPFMDLILLGDGELAIHQLLDKYSQWKQSGKPREAFLKEAAAIRGVYVPSFYEPQYEGEHFAGMKRLTPEALEKVEKNIVWDMDSVGMESMIVPYMQIVHDRIMLEVFRGCTRGCRFCQAGFVYRPVRERSVERLMEMAQKLMESTGYEEISLSSLSTGDYSHLNELLDAIMDAFMQKRVAVSLPSLRIDSFMKDYLEKMQKVRKTGLTFAPEAGTQRLRDVINKGVTEEDLLQSVTSAFEEGYNSVKLYFMIGLPTETEADLDGIVDLARKVGDCYYSIPKQKRQKGLSVTVSTSSFVPKADTPFQWCAQDSVARLEEKQRYLQEKLRPIRFVKYNYHDATLSFLEAAFARGGRRYAEALVQARKLGCRFDGWQDHFSLERWLEAFRLAGVDPQQACNGFALDAPLPWEHLSCGVSKAYLLREYKRALAETVTADCREHCNGCGLEGCEMLRR